MSSNRRERAFSTARTENCSRGRSFWLKAWLPVVLGVIVIAIESTPAFGSDRTSGPLRWFVQLIFPPMPDATWKIVHHLIRKTGHFVGYGTLGLLWLRAWRMTWPQLNYLADAGLALLGTALVASCDEWHQTYLPNRTGSAWDVLLDCCGAVAMMGIAWLRLRFLQQEREPAKPEPDRTLESV
jgi:VanZ family protein